jgi:hypothetical protein
MQHMVVIATFQTPSHVARQPTRYNVQPVKLCLEAIARLWTARIQPCSHTAERQHLTRCLQLQPKLNILLPIFANACRRHIFYQVTYAQLRPLASGALHCAAANTNRQAAVSCCCFAGGLLRDACLNDIVTAFPAHAQRKLCMQNRRS